VKFTFKKHKRETGLRSVAHYWQNLDIKLKGKVVGMIYKESHLSVTDPKWRITLQIVITADNMVKTASKENDVRCGWRNVNLKSKFNEDTEAKAWVEAGNLEAFMTSNGLTFKEAD
jgi:hypothetical protein